MLLQRQSINHWHPQGEVNAGVRGGEVRMMKAVLHGCDASPTGAELVVCQHNCALAILMKAGSLCGCPWHVAYCTACHKSPVVTNRTDGFNYLPKFVVSFAFHLAFPVLVRLHSIPTLPSKICSALKKVLPPSLFLLLTIPQLCGNL